MENQEAQELKDLALQNMIQGVLGNGIEEKLPVILEKLAPKAMEALKANFGDDKMRALIYFAPNYGIVLQKLDMTNEATKIEFPEPGPSDLILIQQQETSTIVIKDGNQISLAEFLKGLMASVGSKLL